MRALASWRPEAFRLRAEGMTLQAIGKRVGRHHTAVLRALNPRARESMRRAQRRYLGEETP